jgi:hypothetical protein
VAYKQHLNRRHQLTRVLDAQPALQWHPDDGALLILDVVNGEISCVEVLERPDAPEKRAQSFP